MAVSARTKVIVWGQAAARCSYPDCRKVLVGDSGSVGKSIILGEIAHIVAQKADGPRGQEKPPGGNVDGEGNLLLVCRDHHIRIDRDPNRFPVPRLVQWKLDHELWVKTRFHADDCYAGVEAPAKHVSEVVHSTVLPVQHIPRFVQLAPCSETESYVQSQLALDQNDEALMAPFIIRGGKLMTFCNLDEDVNPFRRVVDPYSAEKHHADQWWDNPDQSRRYVELLNRSLNKLTGRRGLNLDKEHKRYYFEPQREGGERSIVYQAIGGRRQRRQVAWQPKLRATGEKKHYWEHLAVGLRFYRIAHDQWCLAIRPERRFTRDGKIPLTAKGTGRRSTSKKSRMYNFDVLSEVHFWRDYLSNGSPRILFRFGSQSIVVGSTLLSSGVGWPPIPDDAKRRMRVLYEDDLLSLADYSEAVEFEDKAALEIVEEDTGEGGSDETE